MKNNTFTGNAVTLAKKEGTRFFKLYVDGEKKDVLIDGILFEGNLASTIALRSANTEKQTITIPSSNHNTDEPDGVVAGNTVHEAVNQYDHLNDLDSDNENKWQWVKPVYGIELYSTSTDEKHGKFANAKIRKLGYQKNEQLVDSPNDRPLGEEPNVEYLEEEVNQ
jgi:hypothetical protein